MQDVDAMAALFVYLSLEVVQGRTTIEDQWAARVEGIEGVRSEIVMVQTPNGRSRHRSAAALRGTPTAKPVIGRVTVAR